MSKSKSGLPRVKSGSSPTKITSSHESTRRCQGKWIFAVKRSYYCQNQEVWAHRLWHATPHPEQSDQYTRKLSPDKLKLYNNCCCGTFWLVSTYPVIGVVPMPSTRFTASSPLPVTAPTTSQSPSRYFCWMGVHVPTRYHGRSYEHRYRIRLYSL